MATLENGTSEIPVVTTQKPTAKKYTEKEKARLMSVAKYGPDHIPSKCPSELVEGEYLFVSRIQEMNTTWGLRIGIIVFIDNKEFCIYYGDVEKQKQRFEALRELANSPGESLQICLERLEQRPGGKHAAHYDFRLIPSTANAEDIPIDIADGAEVDRQTAKPIVEDLMVTDGP